MKKTEFTQPAIYIVSVILGELLISKGQRPQAVAGHSLGEYSALTLAGGIDFVNGLKIVKLRSKSMAKSGKICKGTMAAIIGLNGNEVETICDSYKGSGVINPANYNSLSQVVISGSTDAVYWAMEKAKNSGAKIVKELNVSGAFHSKLMSPTTEELAEAIKSLEIGKLICPLFSNVDAKPKSEGTEIKKMLIKQIESPVLWSQSIISMRNTGVSTFLEIGPGRVLSGLNKRIDRTIECFNIENMVQLKEFSV